MNRTHAQALVLVNWNGFFYEQFDIDRNVTALEGVNGAGKTTVMIAAYVVLLPDMSRLRFTNLGETGATGGDKGIWGRLGQPGRPAYSAIDFAIRPGHRIIAGVHLDRKGEPSVEPTPFVITDLAPDVRLQDVMLLTEEEQELVPELSELRENAARAGGRMQVFSTAREYFAFLFAEGVMPLRLGTSEDRNKFNEMLRTSMTGGISKGLTSELRDFLLREESGLANTLKHMNDNLNACRRTRTEVQESRKNVREISDVLETGKAMFEAAFFASLDRAERSRGSVIEAEKERDRAQIRLAEAENQLARAQKACDAKQARKESLSSEVDAATARLEQLQQALSAAEEVERCRDKLASTEERLRLFAEKRDVCEKEKTQSKQTHRRCQDDYNRAAEGLADLQDGIQEIHRRAGQYTQTVNKKAEAEKHLGVAEITIEAIAGRIAETKAELERVDTSRRDAKTYLDDADAHQQKHAAALGALGLMTKAAFSPDVAYREAGQQLIRFRDLKALAGRTTHIAADLKEAHRFATDQAEAQRHLKEMGLSLKGQKPARIEIQEHLQQIEEERGRALEQKRGADDAIAQAHQTLDSMRNEQENLVGRQPAWQELAARAKHIESQLDVAVTSLPELQAARDSVKHKLARIDSEESSLSEERERLYSEAQELLAVGGAFNQDLLRIKDDLGADMLAASFEEFSIEDAAVTEATLGPLVHALVVDDPTAAARQAHTRPDSIPELWLVSRDHDVATIAATDAPRKSKDMVVSDEQATRVTRIPELPRLGRKAREKRAADLDSQVKALGAQLDALGTDRRALERLAGDGEALLARQAIWLGGDPAPALDDINRKILAAESHRTTNQAKAERYQQDAENLGPRIDGLRQLLGMAARLDPPDHAQRLKKIEKDHASALDAGAEMSRCSKAAFTLEDNLHALQRPPLTDQGFEDLTSRLHQLTEDRHRLEAAIEAMIFVEDNAYALQWSDAPSHLKTQKPLVPVLQEQLGQAEKARVLAGDGAQAAKDAWDAATTAWYAADGDRRSDVNILHAAERKFAEIGILEPTAEAIEIACKEKDRLEQEHREVEDALPNLNKEVGGREETRNQDIENLDGARKNVYDKHNEAKADIDRWERLQADVSKHNVFPPGFSKSDSVVAGIGGYVNLWSKANGFREKLKVLLGQAHGTQHLLDEINKRPADASSGSSAAQQLEIWLAVRDWLLRRLPAQVAEVDDPIAALSHLRDQLKGLEARLKRQEEDLRGSSESIARGIDQSTRKAQGKIRRLNKNLRGVNFGGIDEIRIKILPVDRMDQVLRALREGKGQGSLFQEDIPIEEAFDKIFQEYGGGRGGGQRLLDYREYLHLKFEMRRNSVSRWEDANPSRLSTGEAIGIGAALMMVVLTEWEQDASMQRGKRDQGSLRFLFLDEVNRLSQDNHHVLFDLCKTLDLQMLIAAPEIASIEGNTTYRLVRVPSVDEDGYNKVLVSGRRARAQQ